MDVIKAAAAAADDDDDDDAGDCHRILLLEVVVEMVHPRKRSIRLLPSLR